jgi:hypothetical protein
MLDVHSPEGRISGIKDFFLHLFTITIGLLIALALEGCAERWHHHRLRDEAEANLQQEIRDNQHDLATTETAINSEERALVSVVKFLQARSQDKPYEMPKFEVNFTSSTLSDASWRTATATGTLSFMDYKRVQQFASAYQQQELFSRLQMETIDNYLQLHSFAAFGFDPKAMSSEEAKAILPDVGRILSHLVALDGVGKTLQEAYVRALAGN